LGGSNAAIAAIRVWPSIDTLRAGSACLLIDSQAINIKTPPQSGSNGVFTYRTSTVNHQCT
jgi:hypothetical protein